jgi:hypothetical protein
VRGQLVGEPAQNRDEPVDEEARDHSATGDDNADKEIQCCPVSQRKDILAREHAEDRCREDQRRVEDGRKLYETSTHLLKRRFEEVRGLHEQP